MPARPATARFRPARSPVPSTAGGSRGGARDEMPWATLPAWLRSHQPEPRRPYYPHAFYSTLSDSLYQTVSFPPSLVVHAEQLQGSCHIFRAPDPVARLRPAVRKRGMGDRPVRINSSLTSLGNRKSAWPSSWTCPIWGPPVSGSPHLYLVTPIPPGPAS